MSKPTLEEARQDLADIRAEIEAMKAISVNASFLSSRNDVDASYFNKVAFKVESYIHSGRGVEAAILMRYPELQITPQPTTSKEI